MKKETYKQVGELYTNLRIAFDNEPDSFARGIIGTAMRNLQTIEQYEELFNEDSPNYRLNRYSSDK